GWHERPAGSGHADEFVISKEARRKFEARNPGALDYLNRTGELPGYAGGGRVWPGTTRRLSGNYAGHSGIDIPDPAGAPIRAAADGTIPYTGWGRGYGQAVFQRPADGPGAGDGPTAKVLGPAGRAGRAGPGRGRVGSTGRSTGPHIHFEVNPGGGFARASNRAFTMKWLKGAASGFAGATADAHASVKSPFDILGPLIDGAKGALNGAIDGLLKGVP